MFQLAFVALLTGSLIGGTPGNGGGKDDGPNASADEVIVNDTYAYGSVADTRFKFWVSYALGEIDEVYNAGGDTEPFEAKGFIPGTIKSQRLFFGGQLNLVDTERFSFGVGAQVALAQNKLEVTGPFNVPNSSLTAALPFTERDSGFGLQNLKFYGELKGKVLGIHGGYVLDMAPEPEFEFVGTTITGTPVPLNLAAQVDFPRSDEQDAIFIGGSFDYDASMLRVFGGLDYYLLQEGDTKFASVNATQNGVDVRDGTLKAGNDVIFFNMGAGVKFSFIELGVAAILRTQLQETNVSKYPLGDAAAGEGGVGLRGGGHQGSLVPYLVLSPESIPVSLSIRGAVTDEYGDYGLSIGGSNEFATSRGFTAALTVGF